jgi:tRNA A37 threonylcarbamoyladenosine dehydratase
MSSTSRNSTLSGFLVGATCTAAVAWFLTKRHQKGKTSEKAAPSANGASPFNLPQELRAEQLSRHTLYFGDEGMKNIRKSKVCVVGLGGVGSHTAVMLARGGLEYLRLIDFDQVTLSSLNRHACATLEDVGSPKVTCVQDFCRKLGVSNVDARVEMYTAESGPSLLEGEKWDLVIDCIDDVPTKASLLAYCIKNKIRVLACMGAGGKSDVTRLHISDLRTAAKDPLASKLRQTMKKALKGADSDSWLDDMDQLTIIYSSEKTVAKLADLTEEQKEQANKQEFGAVDGFRIRVLPVLGPIPAVMGQSLAAMALCELGKKPILQPVTGERVGRNVRNRIFQHLKRREDQINDGRLLGEREGVYRGPIEIDHDDIEYLLGVWRNRCGVTGARLGTVLELVRWDLSKPASAENLVIMSAHALKAYDEKGREGIPSEIQQRIEERLAGVKDQSSVVF